MLNKIIDNLNKTTHNILLIDVLMNHVFNQMLKEKWIFTKHTYDNLCFNINELKNGNNDKVIKNYIINDYETLSQMIDEFKEDIYPVFNPQIFMILDRLSQNELLELAKYQVEMLTNFHSYSTCISFLLTNDLEKVKTFAKKLLIEVADLENKFIPLNQLKNISTINYLSIDEYLYIYQTFTKTLKAMNDNAIYINEYNHFRFNTLLIMMGDKNV